jgi:amidohydrolase
MKTFEFLSTLVHQVKRDVILWRRYLHQHPELSFREVNTSQFVYDTLKSFGGLELQRPTKTSVLARLFGAQPGKTLALRADMDALPIHEDTGLDFASTRPGVMHACGHDGHTAILLGTAKILTQLRHQFRGEVRFLFQHAEEVHPGGAVEMVHAGAIDGVDMIIGLHLWSLLEVGQLRINSGYVTAASDRFDITIIGKGGHGSMPQDTVDSVAIAAQVITNLQHIVSRNTDPLETLVLSITKIQGGDAYNVIPSTVKIGGTVRSFNPTIRDSVPEMMERVIRGVTDAHGATFKFEYRKGYSPVINDPELTERVRRSLVKMFGEQAVKDSNPIPCGEDFSGYLRKAPGVFFWVGAGNPAKGTVYPHHHPSFWIDEDSLEVGMKALSGTALEMLQ